MGGISLLKKRAPILGGNPLTIQAASHCGLDSSPSLIAHSSPFARKKEPSIKSSLEQLLEVFWPSVQELELPSKTQSLEE